MADKTRIRGITIEIGADTSEFSKGLKSINQNLKTTQTDLRDVNKLLKLDPSNAELLQQKQRLLNQALDETKQKLELEKTALAEIASQNATGEQQRQQDALQREVIETEEKVKSLEKELSEFGSVGLQQVAALGDKFKEIGSQISDIGQSMTMKFTVPITAAFGLAANAASDYEENLNKIDTAFGTSSEGVKRWANNAVEEFGLSKLAATDAVSAFGALAKGVGTTESAAASMSVTLAGLSADLASYFNTGTDESARALEGIFTGEAEALKRYGVIMNETNVKAFAEEHGMLYDEVSDVEKVMIRYQYVLEHTSDAQGDYSRTSDGTANSLKTFKAAVEDLAVAFGDNLLPIITPAIQSLTEMIKAVGRLPEPVQKVIVVLGLLLAAIGPILVTVGHIMTGIGGLMTALPKLAALFGGAGLAGAATTGATAVGTLGAGLAGLAAPIAAALGIVAVGVAAYKLAEAIYENWDAIVAKTKELVDGIKSAFSNVVSFLRNVASTIGNIAKTIGNAIQNAMSFVGRGTMNSYGYSNSIQWHADAMQDGIIMRRPTIFGMSNGRLQGAGESGAEVLVGYNSLRGMIQSAVAGAGGDVNINVYAQQGQDARQIAREVEKQFVLWQRQRKVAMV